MPTTYRTRVVKTDDGAYDAQCACGFTSSGWELKKNAQARIDQHDLEHQSGLPMPELHDFRAERGLNPPEVGVVDFPQEG
jgi:hypothetical protein